jgi:uncharacterized repeat protein (TIGR03803 family)
MRSGIRAFPIACLATTIVLTAVPYAAPLEAATETVLYSFCSQTNCTDGDYPLGGLIMDKDGNLYGTTLEGGQVTSHCYYGCGTVFELAADGTETVIHDFAGNGDGIYPAAGLIADKSGNLYGTTEYGGNQSCPVYADGCGVVFEVAASGAESVPYVFCSSGDCTDGALPEAGLIADRSGNLYGTTSYGGRWGLGTIFELGSSGMETALWNFCTADGCLDGWDPSAGLVADSHGNIYGTAELGGASEKYENCTGYGCGTVFEHHADGTQETLHAFCTDKPYCSDGAMSVAGLMMDKKGNLYGTTAYGGINNGNCSYDLGTGCGIIFKIGPHGAWSVLYEFCSLAHCADGYRPLGSLVMDRKGNLYGTTSLGGSGADGGGTVFELASDGTESVLYNFCTQGEYCPDGLHPSSGLLMGKDGNLYGTTPQGGAVCNAECGTVFEITP